MNDLTQQRASSLKKLLEVSRREIESALPRHLTPDRMLRIAMTEARKTPKLLECTQASFLGAIIQASQVGLEPGGALGHCYLVPYKDQVQLIVGYRGFLDLASRSEKVSSVIARAVYSGDEFEFEFGLDEALVHKPGDPSKRGNLTHVYCVVKLKDGGKMFDVMGKAEVDAIRNRSKASGSGPWVTDYEAMAKKTVVRRLFKFMPASIELQKAVGLDEQTETEQGQDMGAVIETEGRTVGDTPSLKDKVDAKKEAAKAGKSEWKEDESSSPDARTTPSATEQTKQHNGVSDAANTDAAKAAAVHRPPQEKPLSQIRDELIASVAQEMNRLGLTAEALEPEIQDIFKKNGADLSLVEMQALHKVLIGRKAKK